jgi:hypothetical protein
MHLIAFMLCSSYSLYLTRGIGTFRKTLRGHPRASAFDVAANKVRYTCISLVIFLSQSLIHQLNEGN